MSMNLSPPRLWIDCKWTACTSIWLHIHKWKYNIPFKNAKSVLSTCGSFSRPFHEFFMAFSRVFHGLFTFLGSALFVYLFCCSFCGNHEDMTFTPPTIISDQTHFKQARLQPPSFKPVAPWQVAGNISFHSYVIRTIVEGINMRIAALHVVTQSWCWWEVLAILRSFQPQFDDLLVVFVFSFFAKIRMSCGFQN